MIDMITGRVGGGKTYTAAKRIAEAMARGSYVCTNIHLSFIALLHYCAAVHGRIVKREQLKILKPDQVPRFFHFVPWGHPFAPSLCVIDEAQLWFGPKSKFTGSSGVSQDSLEFLTQSRKASVDVTFITQAPTNIDMSFAKLAQNHWMARDMQGVNVPLIGKWPLKQILLRQFDIESGELLGWKLERRDSRVFTLYDSYAFLSPVALRDRREPLKLKKTKAALRKKARARLLREQKKADRMRRKCA